MDCRGFRAIGRARGRMVAAQRKTFWIRRHPPLLTALTCRRTPSTGSAAADHFTCNHVHTISDRVRCMPTVPPIVYFYHRPDRCRLAFNSLEINAATAGVHRGALESSRTPIAFELGELVMVSKNLLRDRWKGKLDSQELKLLLGKRIEGGMGQFDGQESNPNKFYIPLAREKCRIVLTYKDNKIDAVEPGQAFDTSEWQRIADEIENAILVGQPKIGRDYSFSSFRVLGSWRGERSGVQILPPLPNAPRAPMEMAAHPFILEFPIVAAPIDDLWPITNHRRIREHRRLTMLLNVLLTSRIRCEPRFREHFWAWVENDNTPTTPTRWRLMANWFQKATAWWPWCKRSPPQTETGRSRWLQQSFRAPLDPLVFETLSPVTAERIAEVDPEAAYYMNVGHDGNPLRVPADLDESLCRYRDLSAANRAKFNRAAFWIDMADRQWTVAVSSSFASLVTAIEAMTERGQQHRVYCDKCNAQQSHEVPGAVERFRSFFETYAPGAALRQNRSKMYARRSTILHGSSLMQMDQDIAFGFDPPDFNEAELHRELWSITRLALRNWLKNPPV
jgi:hypothetical protein